MSDKHIFHKHHPTNDQLESPEHSRPNRWNFAYWVAGLGSLIWLLLRSGAKPRRLAYPCQQVAVANSLGFLAYLAALLGSVTLLRRLKHTFSPVGLAIFTVSLLLTAFLQSSAIAPMAPIFADSPTLPDWTSATAVSDVFAITNVPAPQYSLDGGNLPNGVSADEALHDNGVDALVNLMEVYGDYFYQTIAHSTGLFDSDDVIVIKVSNQWDGRNGTNSDVVKGLIYRLVNHPDGFTGAVIVAENPQNQNADWYNEASGNNSQSQDQSYQEVVDVFADEGYKVCISDWRSIRTNFVSDYNAGNNNNGYVLDAGDNKLSYPKFGVNCNGMNLQISMRYGLWNGTSFDNTRLKMINMPVLKRHGAAWATIAAKNYLGFITTYDGIGRWSGVSEMHCWLTGPSDNGSSCASGTTYGLIGRQMAHIRRADLDIVDAIWVNPRDNAGWHGSARRQDVLLASRDPFAVDYYASEYILGPLIDSETTLDHTQAMASTTNGWFRNIQLRNVARLRTEGVTDTINMSDSMTRQQELDQFNVYVADADDPNILPTPTLTLLSPNGGESWPVGTEQQIQWSSTNLTGNVDLEYSTDGFGVTHSIVSSTQNDGSHPWTIPNDPSTNVLVRVSSSVTPTISDTNDSAFTITAPPPPPSITLTSPNGGESWTVGAEEQLQWSSANLTGDVKLEYSTDGFATPHTIVASTANDGIHPWTIPNDPSTNVLVRVSSSVTPTISDTNDSAFTIAAPPPPPFDNVDLAQRW